MTEPLRQRLRAWTYALGPARAYQPAYAQIARAIGLERGAFLDLGCGPGWLCVHVAAGRPELDAVGIDTSPTMVRLATRTKGSRLNITVREMDGAQIVYPAATFDAAAAVQSAHHWASPPAVLAEVHRVLKPGGRFFVYEADPACAELPPGWVERRNGWPPVGLLRAAWGRYGMAEAAWEALKDHVRASPFGGGEDGRHGFYRRMVLTRRA